jgi:hypothetical protein
MSASRLVGVNGVALHSRGLRVANCRLICGGMRYAMALIVVLTCLGVQGCVTDKKLTPPDSVMDPRNQ